MTSPTPTVQAADLLSKVGDLVFRARAALLKNYVNSADCLLAEIETLLFVDTVSPPRGGDGAGTEMQACEGCKQPFDLTTMSTTPDGCWLCGPCMDGLIDDAQKGAREAERAIAEDRLTHGEDCALRAGKYRCDCGVDAELSASPVPPAAEAGEPTPDEMQRQAESIQHIGDHAPGLFEPQRRSLRFAAAMLLQCARRAQPIPGAAECSCFSITCAVHGAALYRQAPPAPAPVEPLEKLRDVLGLTEHATWEQVVQHVSDLRADMLRLHREKMALLYPASSPPPATGEVGALVAEMRGWPSIIEYNDDLSKTDRRTIANLMRRTAAALVATDLAYQKSYELGGKWRDRAESAESALATALKERDAWAKTSAACEIALERRVESLTTSLDQARAVVEELREFATNWARGLPQHGPVSPGDRHAFIAALEAPASPAAPPSEGGRTP